LQIVQKVHGKIVHKSDVKDINGGKVSTITLVDLEGKSIKICIWDDIIDLLQKDSVYEFYFLIVHNFPREKPFHLKTVSSTDVYKVTDNDELQRYNKIYEQKTIKGQIEVVLNVHYFKICTICKSNLKNVESFCKKCVSKNKTMMSSFSFELVVTVQDSNTPPERFYGTKNVVKQYTQELPKSKNPEDLEKYLNLKLKGKFVQLIAQQHPFSKMKWLIELDIQ